MRQKLIILFLGLGIVPAMISCGEAPQPPDGQVEIPSEEDPNALGAPEQDALPETPESAINPSDPTTPNGSSAEGGAVDPAQEAAPPSLEPEGAEPQDELPLITEPDPSADTPATE